MLGPLLHCLLHMQSQSSPMASLTSPLHVLLVLSGLHSITNVTAQPRDGTMNTHVSSAL